MENIFSKPIKVEVYSSEQFKEVQEIAFEHGFKWATTNNPYKIQNIAYQFLSFQYGCIYFINSRYNFERTDGAEIVHVREILKLKKGKEMAKNKFIHDEMVRAWLDGEDIQYSTDGNNWKDLLNVTAEHKCLPYFSRDYKYRFKPKTKEVKLNVEVFTDLIKSEDGLPPDRIYYYVPTAERVHARFYTGDSIDKYNFKNNLAHSTEEGAEAHRELFLELSRIL